MMSNYLSPFQAMRGGFGMGNELLDARLRDEMFRQQMQLAQSDEDRRAQQMDWMQQDRGRMSAARSAMGNIGNQNALLGYEGVEGATRPDWLKLLYQSNPELAMQMEERIAQPFAMDREINKAGKLEEAKLGARGKEFTNMLAAMNDGQSGPSEPAMAAPASADGWYATPYPSGGTLPAPGLSRLRGDEITMGMTPQGPKFEVKRLSEFDKAERQMNQLREDEKLYNDKARIGKELRQETTGDVQRAHENVLRINSDINTLQKQLSLGEIDPAMGRPALDALQGELASAKANRDKLLGGRSVPRGTETTLNTGTQPSPKTSPRPSVSKAPGSGSGLPFKQRTEVAQKAEQDKMKVATDTIQIAQSEAEKFATHKPAIDRLHELVTTKDIGNRMGGLPGGETALRVWSQDNDELQKLRNQIIDTIKKEGQSQLMNTLPELAIASDMFPSVTNSPDVNRRSMNNVLNLYEARVAAPGFLEQWAHQHGGSIDGARQMFREWMNGSPSYRTVTKDGKVTIQKNESAIPIDTWVRLRQQFSPKDLKNVQVIGGKVFVGK